MRGVGVVKSKVSPVTLPATFVGRRLLRKEDTRFLTGAARYVGDAGPPRMLHITFVRSTHAHARIGRIRLEAALAVPGVVAAYTGTKIHALAKPIRTPFGAACRASRKCWPRTRCGPCPPCACSARAHA